MEEITLEALTDATRAIKPERFTAQVDRYIKNAAQVDLSLETSVRVPEKLNRSYEACYESVCSEAIRIHDQSALTVNRLINFQCRPAVRNGFSERDRETRVYFTKIKKQQMEVLAAIRDEIEIIRSMIDHSREIQSVLLKHSETLLKTVGLMEIIRERIVRRPTTLLRLEGRDGKILQLNEAFRSIREYEDTHSEKVRKDAEDNPVGTVFSTYHHLSRGTYSEIERRKILIEHHVKDLKRGGKLLIKLATKGYSPLMRRSLDAVVYNHEDRTRDFHHHIRESRTRLLSG
jgi:hypothetical protein